MIDSSFILLVYTGESDDDQDDDAIDPDDVHMSDPKPGCEHDIFSIEIHVNNHTLSGI